MGYKSKNSVLTAYSIKAVEAQEKVKSFALLTVKSKRRLDEICYADEIKSTLNPTKSDFISAGDFIIEDDLTHPQGWI